MRWDEMGWDEMGWGWDGMGMGWEWDGVRWDEREREQKTKPKTNTHLEHTRRARSLRREHVRARCAVPLGDDVGAESA